jgi:hypothetical protein
MGNELKPELSNCPKADDGEGPELRVDEKGCHFVFCFGCGATGPQHAFFQTEAIPAWNRRALSTSASDPVGEPLTMDQRYWLDRRAAIIAALEAEGLQIRSDKDRVWLHRLSASPLPQEPREAALTDESKRLRQLLCDVLKALGNGSGASPECSMEFLSYIPEEVRLVVADLRSGAQEGKAGEWCSVERDGIPPCDGETVYVGINSAGFACCFNQARPDGLCLMGSPECSTAQMSELRWWRMLDRPSPTLNESADSRGEKG